MEGGRYFVHEHPKSAASWLNLDIEKFAATEGVMRTELDQCEFGLMSEDEFGSGSYQEADFAAHQFRGS